MDFHSKLPDLGTTIFTVMSALAAEHNAINLGQGFPDYEMDAALIEKVQQAMLDGHNQYAPMPGNVMLRQTLIQKAQQLYNTSLSLNQVTITPGGTYAIFTALSVLLQPGDEVIVFEPCYDAYVPIVKLYGAIAVSQVLLPPDFAINWQEVAQKITDKTKCIIINNPNNPAGYVLSEADMLALQELVVRYNLYLVSDEVYEHLVFNGLQHQSVLRYPQLLEHSFVCFSFGKLFHCTGWKLGYCMGGTVLIQEFNKIHQFNAFSCNSPMQQAIHQYLQNANTYLGLPDFFQQKKDFFVQQMQNSLFTLLPSAGSYFVTATYERISNLPDYEFSQWLLKEYGVATIPLSSFYHSAHVPVNAVRFCFAKKDTTLQLAAEKLCAVQKATTL